jgi:hypothetical protein
MHRFRVLMNPEAYAREVEREIRFHLELESMQQQGVGLDQVAAEVAARRQFGNVTYAREEVRRMTGIECLDRVRQDIGYAWRGLRKSPGFTAAVVVTLGLGLGVNAAMFSFLDRVFVHAPPGIAAPAQVRRIYADIQMRGEDRRIATSGLPYPYIREIAKSVDSTLPIGILTSFRDSQPLTVGARMYGVRRTLANNGYFAALGVRPALGRVFVPIEDRVEKPAPVPKKS